ncbi:MAG: hypothetical protein ACE5I2_03235 [Anaerolineae bacterium]
MQGGDIMEELSLKGGAGTRWGLGGGLIASLCCLGPTVAALFGLTGATFLFGMLKYRPYFLAAGAVFAVAGVGLALRRSRQTCDVAQHSRNQWLFPAAALLSFGASYGLLTYVTPTLVYRSLTPAAAESQPAKADTYAPVVLPAQVTVVAPAIAPSDDQASTSAVPSGAEVQDSTSSQPDVVVPAAPDAESAAVPAQQVEPPVGEAAGPRRATLAIRGMT